MRILIILQTLLALFISLNVYASDSTESSQILPSSPTPMNYKATVSSSNCQTISAPPSFADADFVGTGPRFADCPAGTAATRVYAEAINTQHEQVVNTGLSAVWVANNVGIIPSTVCCPMRYFWDSSQ